MKIGDILLGRINHRYTHDMSANNSTSMDFGSVQPLYCTYLMKGSDVKINMRQLLRPAPMVSPTFGRVTEHTVSRFVPISEIFPAFDALLSHRSIQGATQYIPDSVPLTSNSLLVATLLLYHSTLTVLVKTPNDGFQPKSFVQLTNQARNSVVDTLKSRIVGLSNYSISVIDDALAALFYNSEVTPSSSDYFFKNIGGATDPYVVCFRLDSLGKRLYKIIRGLGYGLDFSNQNHVSALPLFAFYKAWFDTYFNTRFVNWHNTAVYKTIQKIYYNGAYEDLLQLNFLRDFIGNFSDCLYSSPADYVSIHTADPLTSSSFSGVQSTTPFDSYNIDSLDYDGSMKPTIESDGKVPNIDTSTDRLTYYKLQALKRLTKYISKDSVIGGRVVDWFKVHFGVIPSDDMFMPSQFIDEHIINLDIDDLFATADTYNSDSNSGSYLGSYAGRGLGFSKTDHEINFTAKDFGFLIILGSVAPEQIYSCGDSPQLYGTTRYTLPNTDFDAMGFELTPLACIADYSAAPSSVWTNALSLSGRSFGYIPRYSGFKIQKSVINGDLYLRSTRDGLSSYYLDKLMDTRTGSLDDAHSYTGTENDVIPGASVLWSYPTGISNIGDWNRIFYNRGFPSWRSMARPDEVAPRIDDNFIYQAVFDVKVTNDLKPIRESYDIEDPEENSKASVQAQ